VKVLDLGWHSSRREERRSNNSPTLTMRATDAGMIMGTAAICRRSRRQENRSISGRISGRLACAVGDADVSRCFMARRLSHTLADVLRGR